MIEDIDTIPLQVDFVNRILSQREAGKILFVGKEVYKGNGTDEGKFPISNMTSESFNFKKLINPNDLSPEDLFKSWCNIRVFDHKESINNEPDLSGMRGFSDESLLRVLISKNDPNTELACCVNRDVDIRQYWIDRSWWNINQDRLRRDEYVCCNFLRPFSDNYWQIEPIVKYIFNNDNIKKEDVLL
jgi:hypothetical protein